MPFPADPGFALGYDIPYQDGLALGASRGLRLRLHAVGLAAAGRGACEQHQRQERHHRGRGREVRPAQRKHRARQQPQQVDGQYRAGDFRVAAPATRKPLVGVTGSAGKTTTNSNGNVSVTVSCPSSASSCGAVTASLSVVEELTGTKITLADLERESLAIEDPKA